MERTDDTGFGSVRVIQTRGEGYGVDAVLLAAFAAGETGASGIRRSGRIADLGTGCGIVPFILRHKLGDVSISGFDVREDAVERAERACIMNGFEKNIEFIYADVNEICNSHFRESSFWCRDSRFGCLEGQFDAVVSNPPYFRRTPDEPGAKDPDGRYIARHETTADIGVFVQAASVLLKSGGSIYLVHRPDRLADIFAALNSADIEPKEMQMVVPCAGKAANIVLIHGRKGAGPELRMLPDIAVHTADGGYTAEILRFYER